MGRAIDFPRDTRGTLSGRIFLEGIKFHGYHGLTRMERQVGVRLAVDVSLETDLEKSGRTDAVRSTIDYRKVHQRVIEVGRGSSHKLLESFAVSLLDVLCGEFRAERITVRVRKETPVLDGIVDSVGVELSRENGTKGRP
jgi:dihydroneopterin aldolase